MRKLVNPYAKHEGYNCFGCSHKNIHGLKMQFYEDGDEIVSTWMPHADYQGYINVLHGGIQSTLMDEIASWVVFVKVGSGGVTSRLTCRFKKPVSILEGPITLRAKLNEMRRNIAVIDVKLLSGKGILSAEAKAEYFVFSREKARSEMDFPGSEAFYE